MCWVAIDRGIRLQEKRSLPCLDRDLWYRTRDQIYHEIMTKGWNAEQMHFVQSYENNLYLDASVLIMPMTFFICKLYRSGERLR